MNLRKMLETIRAYRAGAPLGDVAVLKLDALDGAPKGIAARLEAVQGYAPERDLAALRALPPVSLGREYARFLDANGIEPLAISAAVKQRFRDNPFALRYTTTHDLHHVLTGFDPGLAGEAGDFAFSVGQGAAPGTGRLLWLTRIPDRRAPRVVLRRASRAGSCPPRHPRSRGSGGASERRQHPRGRALQTEGHGLSLGPGGGKPPASPPPEIP